MSDDVKEYPYVEDGWVYFNEDMIVEQFVDVTWHGNNKAHYLSHGYIHTKHGDIFTVDVRDLTKGSHARVNSICPRCREQRIVTFKNVVKAGQTKCFPCARIKDLMGLGFGRLHIVAEYGVGNHGMVWVCQCECGSIVKVRADQLQSGNTRSCGCINKERLNRTNHPLLGVFGSDHPAWDDTLTDEHRMNNQEEHRSNAVQNWSLTVKTRDKFTCQTCEDDRGGNLVSHHLNGYKDFPEQRLDLYNGTALCIACHKQFHSWMGHNRIKCTRDDFVVFCEEFCPNALFLNR